MRGAGAPSNQGPGARGFRSRQRTRHDHRRRAARLFPDPRRAVRVSPTHRVSGRDAARRHWQDRPQCPETASSGRRPARSNVRRVEAMSVGQSVSLDQLANFLETVSPFQQFLGVKVVKAEAGMVEILLPFRPELLGEREPPYIHGGVIATLLDIAACGAIMSSMGRDVPTIDLRVDYLRPGGMGDLIARGRTVRVGCTLGVA